MKQSNTPENPIFIVGCPRSGTTLLQSLLTAHPQIASFPESHFFRVLFSRRPLLRFLGISSRHVKKRLEEFQEEINFSPERKKLLNFKCFAKQYVEEFVATLNQSTLKQGKKIWVEKTPLHLHYIKEIELFIPQARFIHILRNGADVVASMYEVTHKYPEQWKGERSIDQCLERWANDIKESFKYLNHTNHYLLTYEKLISNPEENIKKICKFIGIEFNNTMLENYSDSVHFLSLSTEPWKEKTGRPIVANARNKFNKIFNTQEQEYILKKISQLGLTNLNFSNKK